MFGNLGRGKSRRVWMERRGVKGNGYFFSIFGCFKIKAKVQITRANFALRLMILTHVVH